MNNPETTYQPSKSSIDEEDNRPPEQQPECYSSRLDCEIVGSYCRRIPNTSKGKIVWKTNCFDRFTGRFCTKIEFGTDLDCDPFA